MIRHIRHIYTLIASAAIGAAMLTGCSNEEIDAPRPSQTATPGTQLVINLAVPETMETASRAEGDDSDPTMPITGNEGKINSLRLIAFSADGTTVINRGLLIPEEMPVSPNKTAIYEIRDVKPGDYNIYLVANLEQYVTGIKTEQALKDVIINLDGQNQLAPGNLPMVYEPSGKVTIPSSATTNPAVATLSLQFACVKVKYDLLFDKTLNQDIFGNNGMVINSVTVDNVAKTAYLVTNKDKHAETRDGVSGNGKHYNAYTETPDNAHKHGVNVINASQPSSTGRPSAPTTKWAYEGIIYLPERYAADKQTTLKISATVTDPTGADGNVRCRYTIPLGAYDDDPDCKELPRGTYYEVIGKIKGLGEAELDATIVAKDWMEEILPVDMIHTFLTLDKTIAEVTSFDKDAIAYQTDGTGGATFVCETTLPGDNGTEVKAILATIQNGNITFEPNPAVNIVQLVQQSTPSNDLTKGEAFGYIQAGNIKKQVKIKYDITPFFEITPVALKIQYNETYEGVINTKKFHFRTNLKGIDMECVNGSVNGTSGNVILNASASSRMHIVANSRIQISANPNAAEGDITVHLRENPQTTTLHYFNVYPRTGVPGSEYSRENLMIRVQVTTMPPLGDYRIYFRAINDYHHYNGGSSSSKFLKNSYSNWPAEDYSAGAGSSTNWNDWWKDDTYSNIYNDNHKIYIYTQVGETEGTSTNAPVWGFSPGYGGGEYQYNGRTIKPTMIGDNTNRGWYYYDLNVNENQHWHDNGATGDRKPEPGKTLLLFYSGHDIKQGYTLHRAAHHLDPGIPLFDYEDREGWIVYDPTTAPYYHIYDEKPYVEDIEYYVYSKSKITSWWNKYGVASNDNAITGTPVQFTLEYDIQSSDYRQINGWYKTKIKLKVSNGDYEKAIKLTGLTPGSSTPTTQQRAYYARVIGKAGYDNPRIYIYNSDSDKLSDWSATPLMTKEKTENGIDYYYYDIPAKFARGYVIFQNNNRSQQHTSGGMALDGYTKLTYSDNASYWEKYGTQPSGGGDGVVLFGGRSFERYNHVGTYDNGVWTGGAPSGITHTSF